MARPENKWKIENGNGECVKETTTQPKSRQQPKATNGSMGTCTNECRNGGKDFALQQTTNMYSVHK